MDVFLWQSPEEKLVQYERARTLAKDDVEEFWRTEARRVSFSKPFTKVKSGDFSSSQWFYDGELNASYNCIDRHIKNGRGEKTAIVWENEDGVTETISYNQLFCMTLSIATELDERGIGPRDRVAIYAPMTPFAVAAMLATARIGAIHTVVFGGFSKEALIERISDSEAKALITASSTKRKGKILSLLSTVKEALADERCSSIITVLCHGLDEENEVDDRIVPFHARKSWPEKIINPSGFPAEHPLFILYTSGTTGKPKGIFHSTGGYLTHVVSTTKWVFDLRDDDVYWCTADIGWITGHSYVVYGPLAHGATILLYDGAVNWPDASRIYRIIEKHRVSILYTAPTAIRMFMQAGESARAGRDLSSLRLLGSVGEPINPEAWLWYSRVFGDNECEIVDSWWQTETGGMMIVPIPHVSQQVPGSASTPFLGIDARIVDDHGNDITAPNTKGLLVIKSPWPGIARGIWGDQERFIATYFKKIPGVYFTGDGACLDSCGNFIISGRVDDVINVAGHRLGTAEIESALVSHESVAEAAVVGIPDEIVGQKIAAFVILRHGHQPSTTLEAALSAHVAKMIGSFARPAAIHLVTALPKTRSGKIMRRLLRAKAMGETITSDISTLEDPSTI